MLSLSYLLIPKEYSLFENLFAHDKSKESINKAKNDIDVNINQNELLEKRNKSISLSNLNEHQKKLILKLEESIDNFLYRRKVKNLIKKIKSNYIIQSSAFFPDLFLEVIGSKRNRRYKLVYEPILKQNVVFLPKNIIRNKRKLKFVIKNIKEEIFIEPIYKIEYKDNSTHNILDLQNIEEKEYEDQRNFKIFLNEYIKNIKKERKEKYVSIRGKMDGKVKNKNNDKIKEKILSPKANSILKKKSIKRIKTGRKISFGSVEFSY